MCGYMYNNRELRVNELIMYSQPTLLSQGETPKLFDERLYLNPFVPMDYQLSEFFFAAFHNHTMVPVVEDNVVIHQLSIPYRKGIVSNYYGYMTLFINITRMLYDATVQLNKNFQGMEDSKLSFVDFLSPYTTKPKEAIRSWSK